MRVHMHGGQAADGTASSARRLGDARRRSPSPHGKMSAAANLPPDVVAAVDKSAPPPHAAPHVPRTTQYTPRVSACWLHLRAHAPLVCARAVAEFKVRNGAAFETLIRERQRDNPNFAFLFDTSSPAHAYYLQKVQLAQQAQAVQQQVAQQATHAVMPQLPQASQQPAAAQQAQLLAQQSQVQQAMGAAMPQPMLQQQPMLATPGGAYLGMPAGQQCYAGYAQAPAPMGYAQPLNPNPNPNPNPTPTPTPNLLNPN